jgi:hypothetical protein
MFGLSKAEREKKKKNLPMRDPVFAEYKKKYVKANPTQKQAMKFLTKTASLLKEFDEAQLVDLIHSEFDEIDFKEFKVYADDQVMKEYRNGFINFRDRERVERILQAAEKVLMK